MMDVWMEDHNHSIRGTITRIGEIAWGELTNDRGLSYDKIIDEAFEIFEEEQGFKNKKYGFVKMNGKTIRENLQNSKGEWTWNDMKNTNYSGWLTTAIH